MNSNDDVTGQRIIRINQDGRWLSIYLSNGMIILGLSPNTQVDDANVRYPLTRWLNTRNGELIRRQK